MMGDNQVLRFEGCPDWPHPFEPNIKHWGWHRPKHRPPACEQAKAERSAYRRLKNYPTLEGWNYKPAVIEPREFVCGGRETAEYPDRRHLYYHLEIRQDDPCGAAKEEAAWYAANHRAKEPILGYRSSRNQDGYECSQVVPEVVEPCRNHYRWHKDRPESRGEPCPLSLAQYAAFMKEKRRKAGLPVLDRPYRSWADATHICSDLEEAEYPTVAFFSQDEKAGREPCVMAKFASAWYFERNKARKKAGNPDLELLNWKRWEPPTYLCGEINEMSEPDMNHYKWHYGNLDERGYPCGKSLANHAWGRAEQKAGHSIPDYQYGARKHRDGRTAVYRYVFADGGLYIGETKHPPSRLYKHRVEDSLLGEKLREAITANELFSWEVLQWFPTKREAKDFERKLIQQGSPPGGYLLNITHNPSIKRRTE